MGMFSMSWELYWYVDIFILYPQLYTSIYGQVRFVWVVMPCSVAVGYQHFGGPCCLHLQGEVTGAGKRGKIYRPGVEEWKGGFDTRGLYICPLYANTSHFTFKMEAARFFKPLVTYCSTTWCHIPEDLNLNIQHHENLISCNRYLIYISTLISSLKLLLFFRKFPFSINI